MLLSIFQCVYLQFVIKISNGRCLILVTTIFNFHVITGNLILIELEGSRSIQHSKSRRSWPEVHSQLRRSLPASSGRLAFGCLRHLTKACHEGTSGTQGKFTTHVKLKLTWRPLSYSLWNMLTPKGSCVKTIGVTSYKVLFMGQNM